MKNDGIAFVLIVLAIIGVAKGIWMFINLYYEVLDLRRRLGKE